MAIAASNILVGNSQVGATSFTTASISPTANALNLLTINTRGSVAASATPTPTGGGQTWDVLSNFLWKTTTVWFRKTIFKALSAAPGSGTITIDYGAGNTVTCQWAVDQFTGVDTSGSNGAGALGTPVTTTVDAAPALSGTLTLPALVDANSIAFGSYNHRTDEATTLGVGYTQLAAESDLTNRAFLTEYKLNTTTVDASWATSSGFGGIGVEVKNAAAPPAGEDPKELMLLGAGT